MYVECFLAYDLELSKLFTVQFTSLLNNHTNKRFISCLLDCAVDNNLSQKHETKSGY